MAKTVLPLRVVGVAPFFAGAFLPLQYHIHFFLTPASQYSCFVEDCERKCSTPQKRRMHLVDKHGYPRNFFFGVTKDGIDGRRSLLLEGGGHRRRRSSIAIAAASKKAPASSEAPAGTSSGVDNTDVAANQRAAGHSEQPDANQKPDVEMDDLAGAMSALKFVPPSVRFGRGGKRAGFAKR